MADKQQIINAAKPKKQGDKYAPTQDCPGTQDQHDCEITLTGRMECCCPKLATHTMAISLGPQSEPQLLAAVANTANAYENAGYLVVGHSAVDTGAGWALFLTIGWYY